MRTRVLAGLRHLIRLVFKLALALLVGVYLAIVRSFLFVLAVYICLYFFSGTSLLRFTVTELISGEIPGFVTAANVQWGPLPWSVRVADGAVWGEHAELIIRAPAAEADVDLPATAHAVAQMILTEGAPISVVMESARVVDPWVHVRVDEEGRVGIERAFSIPEPEDDDPPPVHDIRVTHARVVGARGRIDIPLFSLDVEGLDAVGDFRYQGHKDPYFLVHRGHIAAADFHLRPVHRPFHALRRFSVPVRNLDVVRLDFAVDHFELLRASGEVDGGATSFGLEMLVGGREIEWRGHATVALPGDSSLASDITDGVISGPLVGQLAGHGDIYEAQVEARLSSPDLVIAGLPLRNLAASLGIEPRVTPDGRLSHRFFLTQATAHALGGRVTLAPTVFQHRWGELDGDPPAYPTRNHLETTVQLEGLDPCTLLPPQQGVPTSCAFSGDVVASASLEEFSELLVVRAQSAGLALDWAGLAGVPLDSRLDVDGGIRFVSGPPGALPPLGDRLETIERLVIDDLRLESAEDRLALDGMIDLAKGTITATAEVRLPDLASFLAPLGFRGFGGDVHLDHVRVGGALLDPAVRARARVTGGLFAGHPAGTVEGTVELSRGVVTTADLSADTPFGKIQGGGWVRIHDGDIRELGGAHPFRAEGLTVRGLRVHEMFPSVGVVATVDLDAEVLEGDANEPISTLRGVGELRATEVAFGGERADRVEASFEATSHRVSATDIEIVLSSGDKVSGDFTLHPGSGRLGGNVETDGLPLSAIRLLTDNELPLRGRVDARLSVGGTLQRPSLIGTVGLRDFAVEPIQLGDAELNITTSPEGHLEVSALRDFPELELLEGTTVYLERGIPQHVVILARARGAEVYRILPPLKIEGTEVRASGFIEVEIYPWREEEQWLVRLDAAPDEVEIELFGGQLTYRNLAPVYLVQRPSGLVLQATSLGRDLDDVLTVCGTIDEQQRFDLRVAGRANLELLGSFDDLFSLMRGAVAIGPDPEVARGLGSDRCLPSDDDAVLTLRGPVHALEVSGRLEARSVRLIPRGFGREFRLDDTAGFLVRPGDEPGLLRVVFEQDVKRRLRGRLDDGVFDLRGELVLADFYPRHADLELVGNDLFYADPGLFNVTFTPEVELVARHFDDDDKRVLKLRGKSLITEGIFFLRLDGLSAAFETVGSASQGGGGVPLTERIPWLRDLEFDLAVTATLFSVRPTLTMGKGELETRFALRAKGNLDDPQLFDRLEIIPGGTFEYDPIEREFEVTQGTLDFSGAAQNPYVEIEAETEISYLTLVGEEQDPQEREVTVSVRAFGPLDQVQVEFFSKTDPALDVADLQALILTGRPRDEGGQVQDTLGVSYDFGDLLTNIIKAPLFEALNVRVGSDLTVSTDLRSRLGRAMELRTRVVQDPTETRVSAGFDFQLTDLLSLEGRLQRTERSQSPTQTYEARLKVRIPID